jgi:tripartite-type tricarboxylate transporter receptor subunit TctC
MPSLALAQAFPDKSKPIRVIAPFGAGTSTDVLARSVARAMSELHGINVVIDNRVGADGVIGVQAVKAAAPDGYTILFTSLSTQVLNPHTFKQLPYDPMVDLIPLSALGKTSLILNMGPSTPFKTTREFIEAAKANPGKYTIGSGTATTRMAGEMLSRAAGVQTLSVPYKSLTDAMTNLAGGQIDAVLVDAATAGPYYKQGVRPVATTGSTRPVLMPQVPTLQEEGLVGFEVIGWFAAYAPAKTPPAAVAALTDMVSHAVKSKYVTDVYATFAMEPLDLSGDLLNAFQRAELDKWGKAVRAAGLAGTL